MITDQEFLEQLDDDRKKSYWRSIRRGMKEADLILGGFARTRLHLMNDDEYEQFKNILSLFDADFMNYIIGKEPIPHDLDTPLFQEIKAFKPYR